MALRNIIIEKVTVNIGVGKEGPVLENAKVLLNRLTGRTPVPTAARVRNPIFKIKKGDMIGAKVTLRKSAAPEFLKKALDAVESRLKETSFDKRGNFSFGVREYIDFPGVKYDPKLGMFGFDVCVTLARPGGRISKRRRASAKPGKGHAIPREESIEFVKKTFGAEVS
ncbi:MAG: 50S ribosomal protein L5 [Candidatus Micrarchaeota archaeon]|nr:50S ribosomal protein L5 [Candidatus Micrarchaeota archaeon]